MAAEAAVGLAALATALATGLGALPLLARGRLGPAAMALAGAAAAGVMAAAALGLGAEGVGEGPARTLLGVVAGALGMAVLRARLPAEETLRVGRLRGADAGRAVLVMAAMTAHSFSEGVGLGVAYARDERFGGLISLAIGIHNVPEGLAISLVLVPLGVSVMAAAGWSIVSSLPQPLLAVPAFVFVEHFQVALPIGLGLAAGAMAWMVAAELVPAALRASPARRVAAAGGTAFVVMGALQAALLG